LFDGLVLADSHAAKAGVIVNGEFLRASEGGSAEHSLDSVSDLLLVLNVDPCSVEVAGIVGR
jgi:hypothetical protein